MAFKTDYKDEIAPKRTRQIIDADTGAVIHEKVQIKNNYTPDQAGDKITSVWMNEVGRYLNSLRNSNLLINGGFQIWQRGTSFPSIKNGQYAADRWQIFIEQGANASLNVRQANGRLLVNANQTTTRYVIHQLIELTDQLRLQLQTNKYLTASTRIVVNANMTIGSSVVLYKSADKQLTIGSKQISFTGGQIQTITYGCDLTGIDLSQYDYIQFNACAVLAAESKNNVYIYWAKLETGEVATPFIALEKELELLRCLPYYCELPAVPAMPIVAPPTSYYNLMNSQFPIPMRTTPVIKYTSINDSNGAAISNLTAYFADRYDAFSIRTVSLSKVLTNNTIYFYGITADAEIY